MRYLGGRCISSAIALLLVTFVVFFLIHLIPGDPVSVMLGQHATPSTVAALRHAMGFDKPLFGQYWLFMTKLFSGNLGESISFQQPVFGLVLDACRQPCSWLRIQLCFLYCSQYRPRSSPRYIARRLSTMPCAWGSS
jgi:peptide/nickel transport system permease protein